MTVKYKTVITKAGAIKLAAATVPNGKKVNFTAMAIGDGGGSLPVPDASQTTLVNEVWRHTLNKISQDNKHQNYVIAELLIPPETGGFWMREMGLYDDTGTLIAVGNMAESYKPELAEGSGRAQTVRMVIMVSDIESVELTIDTSTVMATQDYVDDKLAEHEQSRRHPDATLTEKGFTQLSSATDSTSETLAATPKAVKAAYDLANGKYTAQDATTAQKGIVQLSSATDSASESVAATPKAVKTAYDLANGKYTAQDATTAQKGIVQLSSATDSTSETLAATPKAVKTVSDDVIKLKNSLGNAAYRNVADNASGELIPVGYKGNFKSECNHVAIDFATYPFVVGESLFVDSRGCKNNPPFLTQDFYYINVVCATSPAQGGRVSRPLIQFVSYTNSTHILAIREDDGTTIGWRYFRVMQFDSDNLNVTIPGYLKVLSGGIQLSQNAISIRGAGNKHLWFHDQNGNEIGLVYASDDKVLHLRAAQGPSVDIQSNGSVIAPNYLEAKDDIHSGRNISCVGLIQAGSGLYDTPGVRVYSPNNPPPQQDLSPYARRDWITSVGLISNNPSDPYVRQESSGAIIQLAPRDWVSGNFATSAWTMANFLQGGIRLASAGVATNGNNDNDFAYAPDGTVVTAVMHKANYGAVQYRSLQYNIGGNWYTAWVA
ncbi:MULTISPECIES: tail fiber protein [Enterobacter]|uniref:tail fiber protein n=1 Tax=Enterobacter TaxID=547 RepID=UPI00079B142B|nr:MULTISPECIES: tail fiber protein [Enterobacter cloacae complex]UWA76547.1 phage tail protein [Enterobacter asburiae]CZU91480.1 Tail Fiber protein [Enterobacter asburiae]SAE69046.1 Tail Fiber protein [Enterobacter asburiae]SAF42533.1 Tail Fiber protein [Enterobacter asburiae]SAH24731.1 Tail Fiber protein [Enterobacter asburiae]